MLCSLYGKLPCSICSIFRSCLFLLHMINWPSWKLCCKFLVCCLCGYVVTGIFRRWLVAATSNHWCFSNKYWLLNTTQHSSCDIGLKSFLTCSLTKAFCCVSVSVDYSIDILKGICLFILFPLWFHFQQCSRHLVTISEWQSVASHGHMVLWFRFSENVLVRPTRLSIIELIAKLLEWFKKPSSMTNIRFLLSSFLVCCNWQ